MGSSPDKKKPARKHPPDFFSFHSSDPLISSSPLSLCLSPCCLFSPLGLPLFLPPSLWSPTLSLLGFSEDRVVSQDFAELVEPMLHLRNAGQLGLQSLLLLGEGEASSRVQLLEAPAPLAVELQQVGVVLPGCDESRKVRFFLVPPKQR